MSTAYGVSTHGPPEAPGVLLLHPWWGVTPAVRWWADELVAAGRRVVLPDLYGGVTVDTVEEAEARSTATEEDPGARAFLERCADDVAATGAPWAAMGFSMGAFQACQLALRPDAAPDELVLFYGGWMPDGTSLRARHADLHVAPGDPFQEPDQLAQLESRLRDAGVEVTTYRYDGAGHWFAEIGSPGYDAEAMSLARDRVLDRLRVHIA